MFSVNPDFENSSLKASFSLSSLPPSTGLESPDHAKIKNERLYNSLTKKRYILTKFILLKNIDFLAQMQERLKTWELASILGQ